MSLFISNTLDYFQSYRDISNHYLVLCILNLAKAAKQTSCYKYRTITSNSKESFLNNLSDQFLLLGIPDSLEKNNGAMLQ